MLVREFVALELVWTGCSVAGWKNCRKGICTVIVASTLAAQPKASTVHIPKLKMVCHRVLAGKPHCSCTACKRVWTVAGNDDAAETRRIREIVGHVAQPIDSCAGGPPNGRGASKGKSGATERCTRTEEQADDAQVPK